MADVTQSVADIRAAILGLDVRASIANGIEDINTEVVSTTARQDSVDINEVIRIASEIARVDAEVIRETTTDAIKTSYDLATKENTVVELTNARKGEVNLEAKIDKIDTSLADNVQQLGTKANKNSLPINVKDYGAIGDGIADDTVAFTTVETLANVLIYVPEGSYIVNIPTLTKRYTGIGKIILNGSKLASLYDNINVLPARGSSQADYWGGDQRNVNAQYFKVGDIRTDPDAYYFNYELSPYFTRAENFAGHSGMSTKVNVDSMLGQKQLNVANTESYYFVPNRRIVIGKGTAKEEIKIIASVGASYLVFTENLIYTHLAVEKDIVSPGSRTMQAVDFVDLKHAGGGDGYAYLARVSVEKPKEPGQTHPFYTSTGAIVGGDMVGANPDVYLTGLEMQFTGSNYTGDHDICVTGEVMSFDRNSNDNINDGNFWVGSLYKSEGIEYSDSAHVVKGRWKRGIDLGLSDFGTEQCAIGLSKDQRIYFDTSYTVDNEGFSHWSNVSGNTYETFNSTTGFMESTVGGTMSLKWCDALLATTGDIEAGVNLAVARNNKVMLDGRGSNTYLTYNGTDITLVKNGVTVGTW